MLLDARFLEHGKLNAIGQPTELRNFLVGARFLLAEIVGWKTQHDQAAVLVLAIQRFQV